jgi:hypothetical protein
MVFSYAKVSLYDLFGSAGPHYICVTYGRDAFQGPLPHRL